MSNIHTLRLGPARDAFFCPITRLHLSRGGFVQGTVPVGADLTNIKPAVRSGGLIDVDKTIVLDEKTAKGDAAEQAVAQTPAVVPDVKVPETVTPASAGVEAEPEAKAPVVETEAEAEPEAKEHAGRRQRRTNKDQE